MTPAEAAIGELINAAMSAERELGCNAGMDEGHSVWQALKAAERHVLSELDALRARCESAEKLLRRYLEQRAREQHVMRHGSNSDQEVVRNFYRETRLPDAIDAHLKGAGRE